MDTAINAANVQRPSEMSPENIQGLIKLYVANPVFRSATDTELILNDNPYRRPVRPEDLGFLDYRLPLKASELLNLSALIGHRMLFNIYETDLVYLPDHYDPAVWRELELFYSNDNKILGEIIRPTLEAHVFHFLDEMKEQENISDASLKKSFFSVYESYQDAKSGVSEAILATQNKERVARTFLIQLLGSSLSGIPALERILLGNYGDTQVHIGRVLAANGSVYREKPANQSTLLKSMVKSCDLSDQPHAYWQFYLSTTLALANYSHSLARDHSKLFRYIGALFHQTIHFAAFRQQLSSMLHEIFGPAIDTRYFDEPEQRSQSAFETSFDALITPIIAAYGNYAAEDIARGFRGSQHLHKLAEENLITQIKWIDQPDLYQNKARLLYNKIQTENLKVPIDTFVEYDTETSTTHLHDDERLVVIEKGLMHFWNSFGDPLVLRPGEMTYVPRQRLHGSTVLYGECTYHQPVISPELLREIEMEA